MKIVFWLTTGLFCAMMVFSAAGYLTGTDYFVQAFRHLGYPDYFRLLLGIAKLAGAFALIAPRVPTVIREWAYAGFGITLVSAAVSHASVHDPIAAVGTPLFMFAVLATSRILRARTSSNLR
jgi:type IV secretory pathway TrbD component